MGMGHRRVLSGLLVGLLAGLGRGIALCGIALSRTCAARHQQVGQGGNAGGLKQGRQGQVHIIVAFDLRKEPHRDQRMPTQIKEAVRHPNLGDPEQALEQRCQVLLHRGGGRHIVCIQLGALKALALIGHGLCTALGCLFNQ